jgi:hypothetical protein
MDIDSHSTAASIQRAWTDNKQLIFKSSLRLRNNLPFQLPHAVANTSLNLQNKHTGLLTPKGAALF